jgi:uncharacterized coiled-coil protein SlyX
MGKPTTAQLQERILELEAQIEKIQTENGSQEVIDQLGAKVAELEAIVAEQAAIIEELSKDNASTVSSSANSIKVEGEEYVMLCPTFIMNGKNISLEVLKADPALAQEALSLNMLVKA